MASSDNAAEEINFVIMKYAKSYLLSLTHALSLSLPNKTVQGLTTILTSNLFERSKTEKIVLLVKDMDQGLVTC